MTTTYYQYDPVTKRYTEAISADTKPVNSTTIPPILHTEGSVTIWNGKSWTEITPKAFTELQIAKGTKTMPANAKGIDDKGEFILKTKSEQIEDGSYPLADLRAERTAEINSQAQAKIVGGFESGVLGEPYLYDSELEDQFNFKIVVDTGLDSPYRCTKISTGEKTFFPHTHSQLKTIMGEFSDFKLKILMRADAMKNAVNTINSVKDLYNYTIDWRI